MLQTFTLKNGLKVATYSIPQMKSAFLGISVKAGSIFDTDKTAGTAHFMEHILVEGTPSFPDVESLSTFIESLAGAYNAYTYSQHIKFSINAPASRLEDLLKISSEVFFEPLFTEASIEKERGAILEEIYQRQDATWYKNSRFFSQIRFKKGHPLLLDGGGMIETVQKLQKTDLTNYYRKFFHPKNTYLVLVGGFSNPNAKKLIENQFEKYSSKDVFPGFPELTNEDMTKRTTAIRNDPTLKTCYVDLSFPSVSDQISWQKQLPQTLIRNILGRLRVSRLFSLLRQKLGLVYDVSFGSSTFSDFGFCYVSTQTAPEKLEQVIHIIAKELKSFITYGPTEDEINFAKNYMVNSTLMQFDHPSAIGGWIEGDLLWEDRIYMPEEYIKVIEKVTKKDIMDFMQKYWDFAKLNLVIQGPVPNTKSNITKFSKLIKELR